LTARLKPGFKPKAKLLKSIKDENARLRKLPVEAMVDKETLQVALGRKY